MEITKNHFIPLGVTDSFPEHEAFWVAAYFPAVGYYGEVFVLNNPLSIYCSLHNPVDLADRPIPMEPLAGIIRGEV